MADMNDIYTPEAPCFGPGPGPGPSCRAKPCPGLTCGQCAAHCRLHCQQHPALASTNCRKCEHAANQEWLAATLFRAQAEPPAADDDAAAAFRRRCQEKELARGTREADHSSSSSAPPARRPSVLRQRLAGSVVDRLLRKMSGL